MCSFNRSLIDRKLKEKSLKSKLKIYGVLFITVTVTQIKSEVLQYLNKGRPQPKVGQVLWLEQKEETRGRENNA